MYGNLGNVYNSVGDYVRAMEYHEKALTIRQEIEDRQGAAGVYGNLETCTIFLVNMAELWSTLRRHLQLDKKLGTDKEKLEYMEI